MFGKVLGRSAIVAAALMAVAPAHAISFVFTGNTNQSGTVGTSFTPPAVSGVTVTATAWATDDLAVASRPEAAYLGRYGGGLGVTNTNEGNGQTNNSHAIDNVGSYDFVRLVFSQAVNLNGMTLNGYPVTGGSTIDTDAWVSYGGTGAFDTNAAWQGYIDRGVNVNNGTGYSSSNFSTVWLIGAARTDTNRNDGFKLSAVSVVTRPAVPEPATWLTMIVGFGAIGTVVRKRARVMAKVRMMLASTLGRKLLTGPTAD